MILSLGLLSARIIQLPFITNPDTLVAEDNQVYISCFPTIFILSLPQGKLVKKFGREGEGPGEFKMFIRFHRHPEFLIVNSSGKMSTYTKSGDFIKEERLPGNNVFKPVGKNFAGYRLSDDAKSKKTTVSIDLFDSEFKRIKEIYSTEFKFQSQSQKIFPIRNQGTFRVYKDKIVVNGSGGEILVFNSEGAKIRVIKPEIKRIKVTERDKLRYREYYRNYPQYRQYYEAAKKWFRFPEYFPAIHEIYVADGKIYAETHEEKENQRAFLIMDLEGKILQKIFLEVSEINPLEKHLCTFNGDKFYKLVENEDTEEIELHITDIN